MAVALRQHEIAGHDRVAAEAGRLFEQHADRLLGYCLRTLRSRSDAEDAVQTTFFYAQRALHRGVVPTSEYAWLCAIAKNVCRWQRRTATRREVTGSTEELERCAAPEHEGERASLSADIREALTQVPERQQRALVMREWQGLSSAEVAADLGLTPEETYALLSRARRSFAAALSVVRGPHALGGHVWPLVWKVKGLAAGGVAKAAAATATVAALGVGGGAVVERALDRARPSHSGPPPADVRPPMAELPFQLREHRSRAGPRTPREPPASPRDRRRLAREQQTRVAIEPTAGGPAAVGAPAPREQAPQAASEPVPIAPEDDAASPPQVAPHSLEPVLEVPVVEDPAITDVGETVAGAVDDLPLVVEDEPLPPPGVSPLPETGLEAPPLPGLP